MGAVGVQVKRALSDARTGSPEGALLRLTGSLLQTLAAWALWWRWSAQRPASSERFPPPTGSRARSTWRTDYAFDAQPVACLAGALTADSVFGPKVAVG